MMMMAIMRQLLESTDGISICNRETSHPQQANTPIQAKQGKMCQMLNIDHSKFLSISRRKKLSVALIMVNNVNLKDLLVVVFIMIIFIINHHNHLLHNSLKNAITVIVILVIIININSDKIIIVSITLVLGELAMTRMQ